MNLEIERRFLVKKNKFTWPHDKKNIKQAYIFIEDNQVLRVRKIDNQSFLTYKYKKSNIERFEFEYKIPNDDAEKLFSLSKNHIIKKTRYYVPIKKHVWEIDQFHGINNGLLIAEIELSNIDDKIDFPDWVGDEISEDTRYLNFSLAKKPYTQWH